MLLDYDYELADEFKGKKRLRRIEPKEKILKIWGKDKHDNNVLHHCSLSHMPEIEAKILEGTLIDKAKSARQTIQYYE